VEHDLTGVFAENGYRSVAVSGINTARLSWVRTVAWYKTR